MDQKKRAAGPAGSPQSNGQWSVLDDQLESVSIKTEGLLVPLPALEQTAWLPNDGFISKCDALIEADCNTAMHFSFLVIALCAACSWLYVFLSSSLFVKTVCLCALYLQVVALILWTVWRTPTAYMCIVLGFSEHQSVFFPLSGCCSLLLYLLYYVCHNIKALVWTRVHVKNGLKAL